MHYRIFSFHDNRWLNVWAPFRLLDANKEVQAVGIQYPVRTWPPVDRLSWARIGGQLAGSVGTPRIPVISEAICVTTCTKRISLCSSMLSLRLATPSFSKNWYPTITGLVSSQRIPRRRSCQMHQTNVGSVWLDSISGRQIPIPPIGF